MIKTVRSLRDKKHRKREGRFLAEGLRIVTEARDSGILPEHLFFAGESADHALVRRLIEGTEAAGGEAIETQPEILSKLSGKDNAQAVLGVYCELSTDLAEIDRAAAPIWLVAQALRDPGNLGTMLRTGDAVGAGGLILIDECADPFSVEAVRASMGAIFTQRIARASWEEFRGWLRDGDGQLVGASLRATQDYREARYTEPVFLLVGNEAQGLPSDYEAECDALVKIPMMGRADSLNAAIASAVLAYEVVNQRRAR